ncbi:S8 family peptidase [Salsipaludibacter albus]|uniref:S8 family peptidase n=1 Tax=Salsipaludibacter albus TaxID=2849650 RepID=UPI001EE40E72|nr:S8 family serine peptidase [Salsipaludibacter albus]MBY5162818.1 S8 family serine peptidase [Salsipaludibacter albus]
MDDQDYVVLDLDVGETPTRGDGEGPGEIEVTRARLSDAEAADARRRSDRIVAPTMPLTLIEPMTSDAPLEATAGPTWGVQAVGAVGSSMTGDGVTVAVLDTGIDADHPAFTGMDVVERDFTGSGNGDDHGHGTHCAGTIAGRDVDGTRIGVAPGTSRLLAGKVLGAGGGGTDTVADAIQWSVDEGAVVISMSLGIDFPGFVASQVARGIPVQPATSIALAAYRDNLRLLEALASYVGAQFRFGQSGILVAAAGNESRRSSAPAYTIDVAPPASSRGFLSVAALGQEDDGDLSVAYFSNTGAMVAGPGVDVVSARAGGGLTSMSGTSMATPHVSGVAALWAQQLLAENGEIDPDLLTDRIVGTARPIDGIDVVDAGAGLVTAPD